MSRGRLIALAASGAALFALTGLALVFQREDEFDGFLAVALIQGAVYLVAVWSVWSGGPSRRVIVAMNHTQKGAPKILHELTLPATAVRPATLIVTDMAVIGFSGGTITLLETAPGVTVAEVMAVTEAELFVPANVPEMKI